MQDKREIAKLILAGLLVTASLPAEVQAENFSGNEMYLAVAGCSSCAGRTNTSVKSDGQVADATGQMSTPSGVKTNPKASTMQNSNRYNSGNTQQGGGSRPAFNQDTDIDDHDHDDD